MKGSVGLNEVTCVRDYDENKAQTCPADTAGGPAAQFIWPLRRCTASRAWKSSDVSKRFLTLAATSRFTPVETSVSTAEPRPALKMSSDEEFSLVTEKKLDSLSSLEKIKQEIENYKVIFQQTLKDQEVFRCAINDQKRFAEEFYQRSIRLKEVLEEEKETRAESQKGVKEKMAALHMEASTLKMEVHSAKEELHQLEQLNKELKQQTEVSMAMPEKNVVFRGTLSKEGETCSFDMKPNILFPMEGGTALITFEEDEVAQNILSLMEHKVHLGDCFIRLQAQAVQILEPCRIEMDTEVCPRRILVSNLPKKIEETRLLDKLEIHFSKTRNGGGEVEVVEILQDSGNVVVTFAQDNVAKCLTDRQRHEVDFGSGKKLKVHVTPFLNGEITNLQTCWSQSKRTVLLTGIPDIMEPEELQDLLEIHFQKTCNGGGEVDAFVYNPLGRRTLAIFEEDCSDQSH
ncbi:interferon-induced 35 kDa protein [Arapaima gigas]